MSIFKITFNKHDYDQFDSFIVRSKNLNDAINVIKKEYPSIKYQPFSDMVNYSEGYKIMEIKSNGKDKIILGSFNAG